MATSADLERRHVDVGEHRILQHRLQPRRLVGAAIAGEIGDVDLVGPRQPQQHVGRQRPLVALQQRDVGGRDLQVGGHVGLRQAEIAAQPPQPRAHEESGRVGMPRLDSSSTLVRYLQHYKNIL